MNKIVKFSKSYKDILSIKSDLYKGNKKNLKRTLNINSIYKKQKPRKKCITCNSKLNSPVFFSHGIEYTLCKKCNHLNGLYQNTKEFVKRQYFEDKYKFYLSNYQSQYEKRVKNIYLPKVEFLKSVIKKKISLF